jgi:N-acetylmuramoyl-L-alanine amidase
MHLAKKQKSSVKRIYMNVRQLFSAGMAAGLLAGLSVSALPAQEGRNTHRPVDPVTEQSEVKARITGVRPLSSPTYTRITVDLTRAARFELNRLPGDSTRNLPPRVYVDIFGAVVAMATAAPIAVEDGLVRQVRVGQNAESVARVVLDLSSAREAKAAIVPDPYRLVIDIEGSGNRAPAPVAEVVKPAPVEVAKSVPPPPNPVERSRPAAPAIKNKTPTASLPAVSAPRPTAPGIRKIVLDPGHGGKDPGAIGIDGVAEKDIVLKVARKLAAKLQREMGIEVVLTRKDDTFIPLENRTAIANSEDADLFISLHMNAAPTADAKGLETYYLDNTTDEASIRLAARENATTRGQISDLQFILSDMTQNSKLEDSITLAHNLHGSVVGAMSPKIGEVRDLGVKKALFYVLVGARMPSVLVEMFFITNRVEGRAMAQDASQDTVVDALYDGILKYNQSTLAAKTL